MERRLQPRIETSERTTVTILSEPQQEVPACITNFSGRGMQVVMGRPVPVSDVVQVEMDNSLYFGEVCYCYPERGNYRIGLQLEQVLTVTSDLTRLMHSLQTPDLAYQ